MSFPNTLILSLLKSFFNNGFVIIFVFETRLIGELDSEIIFLPEGFTVSLCRGKGVCLLKLLGPFLRGRWSLGFLRPSLTPLKLSWRESGLDEV